MHRLKVLLRHGLLALILAAGLPIAATAETPGVPSAPPVPYALIDEAACRARLEKEWPRAAAEQEYYRCKIDFARLEQAHPLTQEDLKTITRENLTAASQEQLDQIYARLTAGPIPHGHYEIHLFRIRDFGQIVDIARQLAGEQLRGLAFLLSMPEEKRRDLLQLVWHTKDFDTNQRIVHTRIDNWQPLKALILQPREKGVTTPGKPSPADKERPPSFPAKVYCGQSLLDGRRESIIMDYAFNDDVRDYHPDFDWMMGRHGLRIRDEVRMIRPGFYLGRAYSGRIFLLNFVLISKEGEPTAKEDCWIGSQRVKTAK